MVAVACSQLAVEEGMKGRKGGRDGRDGRGQAGKGGGSDAPPESRVSRRAEMALIDPGYVDGRGTQRR